MKIYISGPISGVDDYRKIFGEAEKALIKDGHVVLNPAILPDGFSQNAYMNICLSMLAECEAIALLPGWQHSHGALIELSEAIVREQKILIL